MPFYHSFLK